MHSLSGFVASLALQIALSHSVFAQEHLVAITVDDLPLATADSVSSARAKEAQSTNRKILRALRRHRASATGFANGMRVEEIGSESGKSILREWVRDGFDLGNHLYSHPDANTLSVAGIEDEIVHGEQCFAPILAQAGRHPEFLRFPFNHTGDTKEKHDAVSAFLVDRGYRLAPCTIDNMDYDFNATYELALSRRDKTTAKRVRAAYLEYTAAEIDWYTKLNRQVLGYDPPHIMLLHDSRLNADAISPLLELFEKRGYRFVSLHEALENPAYAIPETDVTPYGPMWGYRWAREMKVKVRGRDEPQPPEWVESYRKENGPARQ